MTYDTILENGDICRSAANIDNYIADWLTNRNAGAKRAGHGFF